MVTADGCNVEERYLAALSFPYRQSSFTFPTKQSSTDDWAVWCSFWSSYHGTGFSLPRVLGRWVSPTHRQWEWFYEASTSTLQQCAGDAIWDYKLAEGTQQHTRGSILFTQVGCQPQGSEPVGVPCSVVRTQGSPSVTLIGAIGPPLAPSDESITGSFCDRLYAGGGEWMWEHIQPSRTP
jgi:hypothetical protein